MSRMSEISLMSLTHFLVHPTTPDVLRSPIRPFHMPHYMDSGILPALFVLLSARLSGKRRDGFMADPALQSCILSVFPRLSSRKKRKCSVFLTARHTRNPLHELMCGTWTFGTFHLPSICLAESSVGRSSPFDLLHFHVFQAARGYNTYY